MIFLIGVLWFRSVLCRRRDEGETTGRRAGLGREAGTGEIAVKGEKEKIGEEEGVFGKEGNAEKDGIEKDSGRRPKNVYRDKAWETTTAVTSLSGPLSIKYFDSSLYKNQGFDWNETVIEPIEANDSDPTTGGANSSACKVKDEHLGVSDANFCPLHGPEEDKDSSLCRIDKIPMMEDEVAAKWNGKKVPRTSASSDFGSLEEDIIENRKNFSSSDFAASLSVNEKAEGEDVADSSCPIGHVRIVDSSYVNLEVEKDQDQFCSSTPKKNTNLLSILTTDASDGSVFATAADIYVNLPRAPDAYRRESAASGKSSCTRHFRFDSNGGSLIDADMGRGKLFVDAKRRRSARSCSIDSGHDSAPLSSTEGHDSLRLSSLEDEDEDEEFGESGPISKLFVGRPVASRLSSFEDEGLDSFTFVGKAKQEAIDAEAENWQEEIDEVEIINAADGGNDAETSLVTAKSAVNSALMENQELFVSDIVEIVI